MGEEEEEEKKKRREEVSQAKKVWKLTLIMNSMRFCHASIPSSTRLADPNRVQGTRLRTGTPYLIFFFFFKKPTGTCGYGSHLITE